MTIQSPKARFKKLPVAAAGHVDLVVNPNFLTATEYALLEMQYQMGTAPDVGNAAARHWMLEGAIKYRSILLTLAEPEPRPKPITGDNLPNPDA